MGERGAAMTVVPGIWRVMGLVLFWLQHFSTITEAAEKLYFDKFGDCDLRGPYNLAFEEYELFHVGGGHAHQSLICDMTFKAPVDFGICLKFREFEIHDCSMRMKIYNGPSASGIAWRVLDCRDSNPKQMCTAQRYVTIQVHKDRQNGNKGYRFNINVAKSNSVTEEGVLFASIGVFVGIILAVVAVIVILALTVLYCCYKWKKRQKLDMAAKAVASAPEGQTLVQPSAPPVESEDPHWAPGQQSHLYPSLPGDRYPPQHAPPPYGPPPPYEQDHPSQEHNFSTDPEQTYPVKQC